MKTILHNAKVYVEKGCYKQAVLIEDGVIRKVGADEEILAAADELTQVIDCEGKTLIAEEQPEYKRDRSRPAHHLEGFQDALDQLGDLHHHVGN